MSYQFSEQIHSWVNEKGLSRADFIALLQNYDYEEFKGLDAITLSRWFTGKTTPSPLKQLLIAHCLQVDLVSFILALDSSKLKISAKLMAVFTQFLKGLDFSTSALSYRRLTDNPDCVIEYNDYQQHMSQFGAFYQNIPSLYPFVLDLKNWRNTLSFTEITLNNNQQEIFGHCTLIENITPFNGISSFISVPENDVAESVLINAGFFKQSSHYIELCVNTLCYYLIYLSKTKRTAYSFVIGHPYYEVSKLVFHAQNVKTYMQGNKRAASVHLMRLDLLKSVLHPVFLPLIKKKLHSLKDQDNRNPFSLHDNRAA